MMKIKEFNSTKNIYKKKENLKFVMIMVMQSIIWSMKTIAIIM